MALCLVDVAKDGLSAESFPKAKLLTELRSKVGLGLVQGRFRVVIQQGGHNVKGGYSSFWVGFGLV